MFFKDTDSNAAKQYYSENGFVIFKGLVTTAKLDEFSHYLGEMLVKGFHPKRDWSGLAKKSMDELMRDLNLTDDRMINFIKLIKNSVHFYDLISDNKILSAVKTIQGSQCIHCIHDIAQYRIDPAEQTPRLFDWHQDFPYNQTSIDAITMWLPITDITAEVGPLEVIPKSHHQPVRINYFPERKQGVGDTNKVLTFNFSKELLQNAITLPKMEAGDVLFFHSHLLHKSGNNKSLRCRWVVNTRFSNSLDSTLMARQWVSVSDKNLDQFLERYAISNQTET